MLCTCFLIYNYFYNKSNTKLAVAIHNNTGMRVYYARHMEIIVQVLLYTECYGTQNLEARTTAISRLPVHSTHPRSFTFYRQYTCTVLHVYNIYNSK